MRDAYRDHEHWAGITLMYMQSMDMWGITSVEVNRRFRGNGYAGDLLDKVCHEADIEQVTLCLEVLPDTTGLDFDQLDQFYRRRDFHPVVGIQDVGFRVRLPKR